jgi:predicted nucleic acid-binding protein
MVILDTNIIIEHLRRPSNSTYLRLVVQSSQQQFAISSISLQELYIGQSTRDSEREQYMIAVLGTLKLIPHNYEIAKLAGQIMRDSPKTITFADTAIAATAIINQCPLVTLNQKDFLNIPGLELYPIP